MLITNIAELRREAYKLWGIGNQPVIFNFPDNHRNSGNEFSFKVDFGLDKASWPRAYAIAENMEEDPAVRIILPIIIVRKYSTFSVETKTWYDMPIYVHEQIIKIINETKVVRRLSLWGRIVNFFMKNKNKGLVELEDYIYSVNAYNDEILLTAR